MKQAFIFGWTSLLEDTLPTIHACYLKALDAVVSDKLATWTIDDTAKMQGLAQEDIWNNEALWGVCGKEAKEVFYRYFSDAPLAQINPLAHEMLCRLDKKRARMYIVSMKTKEFMLKEVCAAGVADFPRAYFAPDGKEKLSREILLQRALAAAGGGYDRVVVMAGAGYKEAAESLGCCFIEANEENFQIPDLL